MGEDTKIEWTDHTFNPWIGCAKISPGCTNCYAAEGTSARVSASRGLPLWGPKAHRQVTSAANWKLPERWNRAAQKAGERRRVFCASLADVFEERPELRAPRARLWRLIVDTPHLDWLLLTKRPENAARLWRLAQIDRFEPDGITWPRNVWLGTTVEDQKRADERIPHLLATPAAVRFLSVEPLLEEVSFTSLPCNVDPLRGVNDADDFCALTGRAYDAQGDKYEDEARWPRVDWVIVGGESGHNARPFDIAWARRIVADCKAAKVPVFCKQLGAASRERCRECGGNGKLQPHQHTIGQLDRKRCTACDGAGGKNLHFRDKKGGAMEEWPEDLRVREMPR